MNKSGRETSGFLAELAGEATQKLEAKRTREQDHQAMTQSVNAALERTFQFFNLFGKHLDTLEPEIPRVYVLDGKTMFTQLKWKAGRVDYRKQGMADNALMDHVLFHVSLAVSEPVVLSRSWDKFEETKKELQILGLRPMGDLDVLWKSRPQRDIFEVLLAPEFSIRMNFQGSYDDGSVQLSCKNLKGFGVDTFKLQPENIQTGLLDDIARFMIGRADSLPQGLLRTRVMKRPE